MFVMLLLLQLLFFLVFILVFFLCSRAGQETCVQMFFSGHCGQLVNSVRT